MSNEDAVRAHARRRIIGRRIYLWVVAIWTVAAIGMVLLWAALTPTGYFWPVWPILGWVSAALVWGIILYAGQRFRIAEASIDAEVQRLSARR